MSEKDVHLHIFDVTQKYVVSATQFADGSIFANWMDSFKWCENDLSHDLFESEDAFLNWLCDRYLGATLEELNDWD